VDHHRLDPLIIQWQHRQLGPVHDDLIAIDGKHLRRSGGLAIASTGQHKLAAIMFTDMAGYSALSQRNEALELEAGAGQFAWASAVAGASVLALHGCT
jgi:class 3 adenylate cyclase